MNETKDIDGWDNEPIDWGVDALDGWDMDALDGWGEFEDWDMDEFDFDGWGELDGWGVDEFIGWDNEPIDWD